MAQLKAHHVLISEEVCSFLQLGLLIKIKGDVPFERMTNKQNCMATMQLSFGLGRGELTTVESNECS